MAKEEVKLPTYETLLTEAIKNLAVDSGVVSSPVALNGNALTDATKNWAANVHKNRLVKIIRGFGVGQLAVIAGNSSNTLVIKGTWPQGIGSGAVYVILGEDFTQILRDVFGSGADINAANPLETHDPKVEEVEDKVEEIEGKLDLLCPKAVFAYLNAGGEQTVFTFTPTVNTIIQAIWLNLTNLTQNNDIRIKIGGVIIETYNWTTGKDKGVYFKNIALPAGDALLVSMQETADEGADRNIPYYYAYEERG